ncbi:MAG TPA: DNRLRE domain-containing protein [Terriglobales bacterium]|nr:DNRLRE domain-containing protein [Terriglobales bacterium]
MRRRYLALLFLVAYAVTLVVFWLSAVQMVTIYPNADSYSWQSNPLANNGHSDNFEITSYDKPPYNMRGWIRFNTSSIPSDAWIISGTLRLRLWHHTTVDTTQNMGDSTGRVYGVYELLQPWGEVTVNWSNQPNYTDSHSATAVVPNEQGGWYGPFVWMDWNVKDIVNDWKANATNNNGLVVKDTQEYAPVFYSTQFFTKDQTPNSTYYPRLLITYVLPSAVIGFGIMLVVETGILAVLWRKKMAIRGGA